MDKELFLNGSGIKDPTAYEALKDYKKKEPVMKKEIYSGDVVSSKNNTFLVLKADDDKYIPVLKIFEESDAKSIAIQYELSSVKYVKPTTPQYLHRAAVVESGDFHGAIDSVSLNRVRDAVADAIGHRKVVKVEEPDKDLEKSYQMNNALRADIIRLETERDVYKDLYLQLLEKIK